MIFRLMDDADAPLGQASGDGGTLSDGTNVTAELFAQTYEKGVDLARVAFGDEFDIAIVEVADGAGEGEIGSQLEGGHTEPHALNVPGEEDDASLGHDYQR
jgi:hypothetical protein